MKVDEASEPSFQVEKGESDSRFQDCIVVDTGVNDYSVIEVNKSQMQNRSEMMVCPVHTRCTTPLQRQQNVRLVHTRCPL